MATTVAVAAGPTRHRILGAAVMIAAAFLITLSTAAVVVRAEARWAHLAVMADDVINQHLQQNSVASLG